MSEPVRPDRRAGLDAEEFYRSLWSSPSWGQGQPNPDERSRLAAILEVLSHCMLGTRPRILDLGCGRGWLTRALAGYGDVLGTDVVAASIDRARELFPELAFEQTDLEGLARSRGEESFDLVVSSEVLEHVGDLEKPAFLQGIWRLLKPGGYTIVTTPRGELWSTWRRYSDWRQPVEEWISEADLDRLAEGAGFQVERRTRAHVYGITPISRVFASRPFQRLVGLLPVLEGVTYPWRAYQVVLLRRPGREPDAK